MKIKCGYQNRLSAPGQPRSKGFSICCQASNPPQVLTQGKSSTILNRICGTCPIPSIDPEDRCEHLVISKRFFSGRRGLEVLSNFSCKIAGTEFMQLEDQCGTHPECPKAKSD